MSLGSNPAMQSERESVKWSIGTKYQPPSSGKWVLHLLVLLFNFCISQNVIETTKKKKKNSCLLLQYAINYTAFYGLSYLTGWQWYNKIHLSKNKLKTYKKTTKHTKYQFWLSFYSVKNYEKLNLTIFSYRCYICLVHLF